MKIEQLESPPGDLSPGPYRITFTTDDPQDILILGTACFGWEEYDTHHKIDMVVDIGEIWGQDPEDVMVTMDHDIAELNRVLKEQGIA